MSDKNKNEPHEREEYMRESTDNLDRPPERKEGLEEPKVKEMNKIKIGVVIFVVIVLIILVLGISFDLFGLMD
ncbi:hypothetical protein BB776_05090 [Planococcus salinarum]|uniref:Uncharacterized protein n=1 Tax=Planococcus salinarum TaxID=622695 RepID=A0ABX3D2N9_9BACL|nr:hypothetical protein [Planococcus salinarum]OHX56378.1 hypothetical protein BB776_05090 [Planococcus salinarum]TAA73547.1 hypothetical protein D2909_01510 [Planococcus salinarum]